MTGDSLSFLLCLCVYLLFLSESCSSLLSLDSVTLVSVFGVCATGNVNTVVYFRASGSILEELNI